MSALLAAAVLLMFAVPLGCAILYVAVAREPSPSRRRDGYANEWAARKALRPHTSRHR